MSFDYAEINKKIKIKYDIKPVQYYQYILMVLDVKVYFDQ